MSIRELISDCIHTMGFSPREITDRTSGEFALALLNMLGVEPGKEDPNCRLTFTEDVTEEDLPRHAWVFFNGKHYDAESPEGKKDWRQLPVFRRAEEA